MLTNFTLHGSIVLLSAFAVPADLTARGDTIAPTANILEQSCLEVVVDGCEAPAETWQACGSIVIDVSESRYIS